MATVPNIFDCLDRVREHRPVYFRSFTQLHDMVHGYYQALSHHGINEDVPKMTHHFSEWIEAKKSKRLSFSSGWGYCFDNISPPVKDSFRYFFKLVNEYRKLKPTVTAKVTLLPEHQPIEKRRCIWLDGIEVRPDEILVVNYAPTSLNHLRFRCGDRYRDDSFIRAKGSSIQTQHSDIFVRVADEYNVAPSEWEITS